MSLTCYRAPTAVADVLTSSPLGGIYESIASRFRANPMQLTRFQSFGDLFDHFEIAELTPHIAHVIHKGTQVAAEFRIQGVIANVFFLSVVHTVQDIGANPEQLDQSITMITTGTPDYRLTLWAIANLLAFLQESTGHLANGSAMIRKATPRSLTFTNPLLTSEYIVETSASEMLPDAYDLHHILQHVLSSGRLLYTELNCIEFKKMDWADDNRFYIVNPIDPFIFRPGHLIDIAVTFQLVASADGLYKFLPRLKSITQINGQGSQAIAQMQYTRSKNQMHSRDVLSSEDIIDDI
ncbi:uncharacterized protein ARMOST_20957 [Armillaria ostoyae]|uniref:Uncharacterized protein n=1 Tax=Armillaria ostoyae TaxID=47428 RepID=A0A284S8R2_ARMOS|nr:uncharacterized protein ARMOST_20957 [Armillaria ostoyae]